MMTNKVRKKLNNYPITILFHAAMHAGSSQTFGKKQQHWSFWKFSAN